MRSYVPLATSLCMAAAPLQAATVRPMVQLSGPDVRLSDLFDDAGDLAGRVLGPGPVPGGRIVVEAAQLAAIARQFRVHWTPTSGAQAILERPGRPLPRDSVLAALGPALDDAGAPTDREIDLVGFDPPVVALDPAITVTVDQCDYDAATGRFGAEIVAGSASMPAARARVAGRILAMAELPVPVRRLEPGEPVGADDLHLARVRAPLGTAMLQDARQAVGLAPRQALAPGQPIPRADLVVVPLVRKGDPIQLDLDIPGLVLSAVGTSLDTAAGGATIRVRNMSSGAVLEAVVTGPGHGRVQPGSLPLQRGIR